MSRFDFIKKKDAKLYELCLQAEKRLNDDIDVFMLKCRRALERIVTLAGCRGNNLYQKVDDINYNLKISSEMKRKIFTFKDICNENIHYEDETQNKNVDANDVLKQLVVICRWLVEAIIDKKVKAVISDNVKILEKKQQELIAAFKRNDIAAISKINEEIIKLSKTQNSDIEALKSDKVSVGNNSVQDGIRVNTNISYNDKNKNCNNCKHLRNGICQNPNLSSIYYGFACLPNSYCELFKQDYSGKDKYKDISLEVYEKLFRPVKHKKYSDCMSCIYCDYCTFKNNSWGCTRYQPDGIKSPRY